MKKTIVLAVMFLVLSAGAAMAADYAVIVNPANGQDSLSTSEAKDIFLGRKTVWAGGARVTLYVQSGASFHGAAIKDLTGKNPQ